MKLIDVSLRKVAIGVLILGVLNWAALQFLILPNMPEDQRERIYSGWASTPYPYAASIAFILFAAWFVFWYRGQMATHGRKITIFAMGLGALIGMVLILAFRIVWHV